MLTLCSLISHADYKLHSDLKPHRKVVWYPNRQKVKILSLNLKVFRYVYNVSSKYSVYDLYITGME